MKSALLNILSYKNFGIVFFCLSVLFFSQQKLSAQNLVTNPSFETAAWPNANSGSADWLLGPTNVFGAENAFLGTRFMGISMGESTVAGVSDFREYVKAPLTTPLVIGNTYEVSVMVSLSENYGNYACNSIGFATSTVSPFFAITQGPIPMSPVYSHPAVVPNKVGWTQVGGTFTATNADAHIVIGTFLPKASMTWQYVGPSVSFYYGYYFLDQGCLGPPGTCNIPLPLELLSFSAKRENGIPVLKWSTSCSLDCDQFIIERSSQGLDFEPIGMIEASESNAATQDYHYTDLNNTNKGISYYRIKEIERSGKRNYSNMIALDLSSFANPHIVIYPVPSEHEVNFDLEPVENLATFQIFDQTGKIVYEKNITGPEKIKVNSLASGSYFAIIRDENGQSKRKKFIITGNE